MSNTETTPLLSESSSDGFLKNRDAACYLSGRDSGRDNGTPNNVDCSDRSSITSTSISLVEGAVDLENGMRNQGRKLGRMSLRQRLQAYLLEEVPSNRLFQAQLLFLTFTTGIVDGTTLTNYNCFATKQTGNTVFLALRVARHPYVMDQEERNIVFSFVAFVTGTVLFARMGHLINMRRRGSLLLSASVQTLLVWIATALACFITEDDTWPIAPVIMVLLALAAGGQITIAIQMKQQELNTSMITGAVIQLCNDNEIFKIHNEARDRRLLFFICFFVGIIAGAALTMYDTPGIAFLTYASCKTMATLSLLFNPAVREGEQDVDPNRRQRSASPLFRIIWGDS